MEPKLKPLPWPCRLAGGRPPLAGGCGIGEGEVAGEVMRGLGVLFCGAWGTLFAMAGEPPAFIEPKLILGRLLEPLAMGPEVPAALMVMEEGLRPWAGAPLAIGAGPTAGTAGWI